MTVMVMSVELKQLKLIGLKMRLVDGKWTKYPILNKYNCKTCELFFFTISILFSDFQM